MIEIGLTSNIQEKIKDPEVYLELSNEKSLFNCWDVNFNKLGSKNAIYISHCSSGYSIVVTGMKPRDYKNFTLYLSEIIRYSLEKIGISQKKYNEYLTNNGGFKYTKTHGRKAIGHMTEVRMDAEHFYDYVSGADETIQWEIMEKLNKCIFHTAAYTDYVTPVEKILEEFNLSRNDDKEITEEITDCKIIDFATRTEIK